MRLPTMQTEPIRIAGLTATLLAAICGPVAVYLVAIGDPAIGALVAGIGTAIAGVTGTEAKRALTTAPANTGTIAGPATNIVPLTKEGIDSQLARAIKHSAQTNPDPGDTPNA